MESEQKSIPVAQAIQAGIEHHQAGRLAEAEHLYRRVLEFDPANAEATHLVGVVAGQMGKTESAVELIGRAVAMQPENPIFQNNFGNVLKDTGRRAEAEQCYRRALALKPDHAEAHGNLGLVLLDLGRSQEAEHSLRHAIALKPDFPDAHNNLGVVLYEFGRPAEAEQCYRRALELRPGDVEAQCNLGQAMRAQGRLSEAEDCFQRALALRPAFAEAHNYLANVLRSMGRLEDAEDNYRRALAIDPGLADAHSNLLFLLNYIPEKNPEEIFTEHRRYAQRFCPAADPAPHGNMPDPDRRLRIGYVSGDLRDHPVAFFIEPALAARDRDKFEIFCYYNYVRADAVTERLRSLVDHWREVFALGDEALASVVREDAIDILVDLSGHTGNNRLRMFGHKPAPVQATWLGYLNTTGLDAIDYRITDAHATPEGRLDSLHSEKLVRLPDTQCCYRPPAGSPDVSPPPCTMSGCVTFASFTNPAKIGRTTIELWGRILARVPSSRLLVVGATLTSIPDEFVERFTRHGVGADRLQLVGAKPFLEYLALHGSADIILDTFPYSSGTTTCHALWMGVPVVTLAGEGASSRTGANLLHAVGLEELVARTPEQYLEIAAGLAVDPKRLAALRAGMRERMAASPLMNEARFTRNLERAFRSMWHAWCESRRPFRMEVALPGLTAAQAFQTGLQHQQAGKLDQAEAAYRRALELDPAHAEAHNNLGNVLHALGRTEDAVELYRRTLELLPASAAAHNNLGKALATLGHAFEAEQSIRRALACQPDYAEAHNDLGKLLQERGLREEAERCYRHACALKPDLAAARFNLANLMFSVGRLEEAELGYRRAMELNPAHAETQSNLAFMLNYVPGKSPAEIYAAHRGFAQRFCPPLDGVSHGNAPDPARKLRIGYVSGDFRNHAVAFFIEPVLAMHDRGQFEIFCYYNAAGSDAVTMRLKSHADHWREVSTLDDEALAALIRSDAIDLLVDLSGHTIHNRLFVFGRKPAPVQATWLGYLNTTGLEAIDYRITDLHATPRGLLDTLHSEELVRLPDSQWCYRPPAGCPEVSPPPSAASGVITFASFANLSKISAPTLELWGRLLARVPESRLLVVSAILPSIPSEYADRLAQQGIDAARLELLGMKSFPDYLVLHRLADIVLDTFPFSGGTTTCHALWMGVPIVTLAGETATSRGGASLLHPLGLETLVATSPDQYLEIAAALANDRERLGALRSGMRARMAASALMDEKRFTCNLETAYRAMWRNWCENSRS